jgi:hypothetical protein
MNIRNLLGLLAASLSLVLAASVANAQATRTWVSGVGDDLNPCSRTAPCKTFAGAISKTAAGGEINCLDPAGYGAFTATKSITVDCEDTQGSILASGTTGVLVNTAGVVVTLRGLSINGGTPTSPGLHGVRFLQGASLAIFDCIIQNFTSTTANVGNGVTFTPSTAGSRLVIRDSVIVNNGGSSTSSGIVIAPTGAGTATGTIHNSSVLDNTGAGILINGASTIMITNSNVSGNTTFGIRTASGAPTVRVGGTGITGNGTGVSVGAGTIESYCTNQLNGNSGDGAFFGACLAQK